jgi:hypothetical protein
MMRYPLLLKFRAALFDLLPVILVVAFFQLVILRQPLPQFFDILLGTFMVILGLMLFVQGLTIGLFPIGETVALSMAKKGNLFWLLSFAFLLGFSTTIAEPALIAVAGEAADIAAKEGLIGVDSKSQNSYAFGLRLTVAVSVGTAILIGILRILKGWPIHYLIIGGYCLVMLMTIIAPKQIVGIAYDTGGVTTSTITVPLVAALGVGLATVLRGRSPMVDGFGLIAFASLLPMIFVMAYGLFIFG